MCAPLSRRCSAISSSLYELRYQFDPQDGDFKPGLTDKLCLLVQRHAPNKKWHVDNMTRILSIVGVSRHLVSRLQAGEHVSDEICNSFVNLVACSPELQAYSVHRLYRAMLEEVGKVFKSAACLTLSQHQLVAVAMWCLGEFGELLATATTGDDEQSLTPVTWVCHVLTHEDPNRLHRLVNGNGVAVLRLCLQCAPCCNDGLDEADGPIRESNWPNIPNHQFVQRVALHRLSLIWKDLSCSKCNSEPASTLRFSSLRPCGEDTASVLMLQQSFV